MLDPRAWLTEDEQFGSKRPQTAYEILANCGEGIASVSRPACADTAGEVEEAQAHLHVPRYVIAGHLHSDGGGDRSQADRPHGQVEHSSPGWGFSEGKKTGFPSSTECVFQLSPVG